VTSLRSNSQDKLLPLPPSGRAHLFPVAAERNLGETSMQLSWRNQVARIDCNEFSSLSFTSVILPEELIERSVSLRSK